MNTSPAPIASQDKGLPVNGDFIISPVDRVLITGAAGFIGARVLQSLLDRGFRNIICFVRPTSDLSGIEAIIEHQPFGTRIEVVTGNLLSRQDCEAATKDVALIYHLAAGTGEKSFPDAFLNSVVATRNLLDGSLRSAQLRRFVLVSSFAVYSNCDKPNGTLLDESCPVEEHPELRGEAYCFAKVKQEKIVADYGKNHRIPYVLVRPGSVYGAIKSDITGRVGISAFGPYIHLGGSNTIPFTFVDNCAEAIVLAGLVKGVDGEAFNVVDDDLPSSRQFLRRYKKNAKKFKSIYVPHMISYALCYFWEKYSKWSEGQLPPVFNRKRWHAEWKKTRYSNQKLKNRLGWKPRVSTAEGLRRYIEACGGDKRYA
jgi:nucleoside-diphosphate-sugar epimerase